jgi:hypothetical protein
VDAGRQERLTDGGVLKNCEMVFKMKKTAYVLRQRQRENEEIDLKRYRIPLVLMQPSISIKT